MSDQDDATIEAGEDLVAEVRRLAAEARAEIGLTDSAPDPGRTDASVDDQGVDDLGPEDDVTIDASSDVVSEIRDLAAKARWSSRAATTPESDVAEAASATTPPDVAEAASAATPEPDVVEAASAATPEPDVVEVTAATTPVASMADLLPPPDPQTRVAPEMDRPAPAAAPRSVTARDVEPPVASPGVEMAAPAAPASSSKWEPPTRMVAPTDPDKIHAKQHANYRAISLGLAAVLVVLVILLATGVIGGGSGGDEPADDGDVPADVDGSGGFGAG